MHLWCKVGGRRSEVGEIMRLRCKFGIRNSAPAAQIRNSEFGIRRKCNFSEATAEALYQTQSNFSEGEAQCVTSGKMQLQRGDSRSVTERSGARHEVASENCCILHCLFSRVLIFRCVRFLGTFLVCTTICVSIFMGTVYLFTITYYLLLKKICPVVQNRTAGRCCYLWRRRM